MYVTSNKLLVIPLNIIVIIIFKIIGEKIIKITKTATLNVKKTNKKTPKQHIIFTSFKTIISTERNVSFSSRHLECF